MYSAVRAEAGLESTFTGIHSVTLPTLSLVRGYEKKWQRREGDTPGTGKLEPGRRHGASSADQESQIQVWREKLEPF